MYQISRPQQAKHLITGDLDGANEVAAIAGLRLDSTPPVTAQ
jgi:hypothetical protein